MFKVLRALQENGPGFSFGVDAKGFPRQHMVISGADLLRSVVRESMKFTHPRTYAAVKATEQNEAFIMAAGGIRQKNSLMKREGPSRALTYCRKLSKMQMNKCPVPFMSGGHFFHVMPSNNSM